MRAVEKHVFWVVAAQDPQMDSCTLNFRSCSRSFVSLLHTVACPSRCLLTCPTLRSGGAGLFRTQLQVRAIVFWGVGPQNEVDPETCSCLLRLKGMIPVVRFTSAHCCLSLWVSTDMSYAPIRGRGSVSDSVAGARSRKICVLGGCDTGPRTHKWTHVP